MGIGFWESGVGSWKFGSGKARATGVYAHDSRALLRLDYDYDGDGRIDVRTYMRQGRPVRLEGDGNRDGLIDRWEYYGRDGELLRIGGSTRGDGREDMWVRTSGDERVVEISMRRDGVIDRREVYHGDTLVRAESDTNHDGLPDRWEDFRDGVVVRLMLDDERRYGRPTRRIVYDTQATARVETDADGDGVWEASAGTR
ncbi:MAG: hypothetical protein ACRD26_20895 [Vicinamibacterales bacterium]